MKKNQNIILDDVIRIKELMQNSIISEQPIPAPVGIIRNLISKYGDDAIKLMDDAIATPILNQIKTPNVTTITDEAAEILMKNINWNFLAEQVFIKSNLEVISVAKKFVKKAIEKGNSIQNLKDRIAKKYTQEEPFSTFPLELQEALIKIINDAVDTIVDNPNIMKNILINLDFTKIKVTLSDSTINILNKQGFSETFKTSSIDFLKKSEKIFREIQSIIRQLSPSDNSQITAKESEILIKQLNKKMSELKLLDIEMVKNLRVWVTGELKNYKSLQSNLLENIKIYDSVIPILTNFWSRWGLSQAWDSYRQTFTGIKSGISKIPKIKTAPSGVLDIAFGKVTKELNNTNELIRKLYNIAIGTRRTLSEYRVLAKQIGLPATFISYATESMLLQGITLAIFVTYLKGIRNLIGVAFGLSSTKNVGWNEFWGQWKKSSGILDTINKSLFLILEKIPNFISKPGFLFKYGKDVYNFADNLVQMVKGDFNEVRNTIRDNVDELIDQGEQGLGDLESNIRTQTTGPGGTLEHFKAVYRDENARDLGDGRFQHSDGTIYKWDSTEQWYEPQS